MSSFVKACAAFFRHDRLSGFQCVVDLMDDMHVFHVDIRYIRMLLCNQARDFLERLIVEQYRVRCGMIGAACMQRAECIGRLGACSMITPKAAAKLTRLQVAEAPPSIAAPPFVLILPDPQ